MRILVAEDDEALANMLVKILRDESYAVDRAADGQEAEWLAYENPYDLILLDLMLPVKSGQQVLAAIRESGNQTPVLILTALDSKDELIRGLDQGADDYVTKPFSVEELLARVRVLMKRRRLPVRPSIKSGPIEINPNRREVLLDGKTIELTTKEYGLLEYFVRNSGQVLSRVQLSEHVWDMNFEPNSNVVDVYIGYLRQKIDKPNGTQFLKTVRGHGYMLDTSEAVSK